MAPATAIAGGKGYRGFADCRRQKQTGKTGNKIPIKYPKINDFYDLKHLKLSTNHVICESGPIFFKYLHVNMLKSRNETFPNDNKIIDSKRSGPYT